MEKVMRKSRKTRLLICSSPLQVINARSAMDYRKEKGIDYRDYLIITHPRLTETSNSKNLIKEFSAKLGFSCVYDFSEDFKRIIELVSENYKFKHIPFAKSQRFEAIDHEISGTIEQLKRTLYQDVDHFDEIYIRRYWGHVDHIALASLIPNKVINGIEDGLGDYCKHLKKEIRFGRAVFQFGRFKDIVKNFIFISKSKQWRIHSCNFGAFYLIEKTFSNLKYGNNIIVAEHFKKNLQKLRRNREVIKNKVIAILDSVLDTNPQYITTEQEVEICNRIIAQIKKRHGVCSNQIYYKPHPRTTFSAWSYKKKNLDCRIYDFKDNSIFELELLENNFKAVYSVGSTSSLLAKALFDVDVYAIDLRRFNLFSGVYIPLKILLRYGAKIQPA